MLSQVKNFFFSNTHLIYYSFSKKKYYVVSNRMIFASTVDMRYTNKRIWLPTKVAFVFPSFTFNY